MSMRPLAALGLAGLIMLVCVSLSKAAPEPAGCDSKETVAADVMKLLGVSA